MRHQPLRVKTTNVVEWNGGQERPFLDDLAVEEPLEIRIDGEGPETEGHDVVL